MSPTAPPPTYTRIIQIQPITGRAKARVWFATDTANKQVVVKGPVKASEAKAILKTEALKKVLGFPNANVRTEDYNGKTYIVSDNLLGDYTTFPTKEVTTKLEKQAIVVDVEKADLSTWNHAMLECNGRALNLLLALAFRKIAGSNDTCLRNIVVVNDTVFSVDDAAVEKETTHMWSKGLIKPKAAYEAALTKHWDEVFSILTAWKAKLPVDSYAIKQIEILSVKEGWKW